MISGWLIIVLSMLASEPTSQPGGSFFGSGVPATTQADYFSMSPGEFARVSAANETINFSAPNQTLLRAAILHETNKWRAKEGLKPLLHHPQVDEAAMIHVRDMVAKNYLAHVEQGTTTPQPIDRVRAAGLSPILVAENIATASGIQYESGRQVFPLRQWKREGLSYKENGEAIPPHTYRTFAAQVLQQWIDSPSHRESIMLRDARYLGSACLPANPKSQKEEAFHKFFCAQVFFTPSRFARDRSSDDADRAEENAPDARDRQPDAAPPEPPVPDPIGSEEPPKDSRSSFNMHVIPSAARNLGSRVNSNVEIPRCARDDVWWPARCSSGGAFFAPGSEAAL
jgi:uncharacterized protein YkwD